MENSDMPAIAYEIEEFEVPSQKYTFLKSCLKFLQPIISQQLKTNIDMRTLGYCVVFLVNHVLLKIPTRTFKSIQEKVYIYIDKVPDESIVTKGNYLAMNGLPSDGVQ
jgi:surface polysaccharide O-acyltransferase-like enzyme